jgi:rubrerythrin
MDLPECIVCGSVVKKNQKKCPNCGASQEEDDDY